MEAAIKTYIANAANELNSSCLHAGHISGSTPLLSHLMKPQKFNERAQQGHSRCILAISYSNPSTEFFYTLEELIFQVDLKS